MNILCIDDRPDLKYVIVRKILESENVHLKFRKSYIEAVDYISNHFSNIDGIFLDLGFPKFEDGSGADIYMGLEIVKFMKVNNINIPILIYSTTDLEEKYFFENPICFGQMGIVEKEKIQKFINYLKYH